MKTFIICGLAGAFAVTVWLFEEWHEIGRIDEVQTYYRSIAPPRRPASNNVWDQAMLKTISEGQRLRANATWISYFAIRPRYLHPGMRAEGREKSGRRFFTWIEYARINGYVHYRDVGAKP